MQVKYNICMTAVRGPYLNYSLDKYHTAAYVSPFLVEHFKLDIEMGPNPVFYLLAGTVLQLSMLISES